MSDIVVNAESKIMLNNKNNEQCKNIIITIKMINSAIIKMQLKSNVFKEIKILKFAMHCD